MQIMSRRNFTVYTYDDEIEFLKSQVRQKDHIETGGDLFGLWLDDRTLVIQLITGPGQNCKRTVTSFFQDVEYLGKVGTHLTTAEGVCNVGEWHSHHRLGLPKPSYGDEETVWRSMPEGLTRFAVFIANISGPKNENPQVNVGCFLFDKLTNRMITGEFKNLKERSSPLREKPQIQKLLESGAEKVDSIPSDKRRKRRKDTKRKNREISSQFEKFEDDKKIGRDGEGEGISNKTKRNKREETCGVKKGGNVEDKSKSDVIAKKERIKVNVGDDREVDGVSGENCNQVGEVEVAEDKPVNSEVKTRGKNEGIESDKGKNPKMKIDKEGNEGTDEIAEGEDVVNQTENTNVTEVKSQIPQEEEVDEEEGKERKAEVEGRQDENKEKKWSPKKQGRRKSNSKPPKKDKKKK